MFAYMVYRSAADNFWNDSTLETMAAKERFAKELEVAYEVLRKAKSDFYGRML